MIKEDWAKVCFFFDPSFIEIVTPRTDDIRFFEKEGVWIGTAERLSVY